MMKFLYWCEKKTNISANGVVFKQERKTGVEVTAKAELSIVMMLIAHSKLTLQTAMHNYWKSARTFNSSYFS